jgi:hypothetical protein
MAFVVVGLAQLPSGSESLRSGRVHGDVTGPRLAHQAVMER